jgi:hypothetical protein
MTAMSAIAAPLIAEPLWARARAMFARAVVAIGDAAAIAILQQLPRPLRRRIVAWLAPLEHIVRKLLLAEAAALRRAPNWTAGLRPALAQVPQSRSAALRAACAAGAARSNLQPSRVFDPSRPETWPACFSFALPRDPLAVPDARAPRIRALWVPSPPPAPPQRAPRASNETDTPFRLARRFEALRRVLENPLPHAQRLARLLARAVRRFPEIVQRCVLAPARTGDYDREDPRLGVDAITQSWGAPKAFAPDSS